MKQYLRLLFHDIAFPAILALLVISALFSTINHGLELENDNSYMGNFELWQESLQNNVVLQDWLGFIIILLIFWASYKAAKRQNHFIDGLVGSLLIGLIAGISYSLFAYAAIRSFSAIFLVSALITLSAGIIGLFFGVASLIVAKIAKEVIRKKKV